MLKEMKNGMCMPYHMYLQTGGKSGFHETSAIKYDKITILVKGCV